MRAPAGETAKLQVPQPSLVAGVIVAQRPCSHLETCSWFLGKVETWLVGSHRPVANISLDQVPFLPGSGDEYFGFNWRPRFFSRSALPCKRRQNGPLRCCLVGQDCCGGCTGANPPGWGECNFSCRCHGFQKPPRKSSLCAKRQHVPYIPGASE